MKRALDIVGASAALVLCSPLMLLSAVAVLVSMGRPILFRQRRPGWNARPFTLLKFRTMTQAIGPDGQELADEHRLTRVGALLRRFSLDELPQLFNVLRGEMSLVGPRPLLMEYLPLYDARQARRHEVRPGITGWAQINGRNAVDWNERFELDVWYVEHRSLRLDLEILARTALRVVRPQGVSREGHATMPRFTGGHVQRNIHGESAG